MITGTTPRGSAIILTKMKKPEQFNSRKEWESFIWDKAIDGLAKAGSKTNVNEILNELLGEYEKKLMLRRLTAILLIKDGLSYSQIGEILWVSPSTISAIKKSLSSKGGYVARKKMSPRKYSHLPPTDRKATAGEDFLNKLAEYFVDLQMGYTDPKYRWRFLNRQ